MPQSEKNVAEIDRTRRTIFIVVALVAALLVAGVFYLVMRPSPQSEQPRLEGALRPGAPEFEQYRERIMVDFNPDEDATTAVRPLGDRVLQMKPTIRNFSGRTINGLELRVVVVDLEDTPLKERTVVAIPASGRPAELEPNRTLAVPIMIDGLNKDVLPANIKVELTGVKFK